MVERLELASTWTERLRGLLGRKKIDGVIVLAPCRSIHTFGMKYCIDVAFIDKHGRVLGSVRAMKPKHRARLPGAYAVIERAALPNEEWPRIGDVVGAGIVHAEKNERSNYERRTS